ncbi:monocarboxylate transporter 12-like isoform X1 [Dermacentor albipictus]|uniref:monocarboxylate transporter 12-like isoform X1 n=1 Tax=Dermacentor albipictus TaxID=60249 RepID=UPI0038FC3703
MKKRRHRLRPQKRTPGVTRLTWRWTRSQRRHMRRRMSWPLRSQPCLPRGTEAMLQKRRRRLTVFSAWSRSGWWSGRPGPRKGSPPQHNGQRRSPEKGRRRSDQRDWCRGCPLKLSCRQGRSVGFIGGPLAHRFNARPVIIAGAAISAAGAILSFFATTIAFMTVTLGVIHAIGAGMVFIVAPTIISEHFVKNKGLAMGVNFTGITAGLFVFPKLLEYLTAAYGLRGALLIFGAVTMNGLAFSLFPRTPAWRKASRGKNQLAAQFPSKAIGDSGTKELRHALTVFKSPVFYLIIYSFNAYCFAYECYISLFVDFACDRGVALSTAVTAMSAGAIAEILGRLTLPAAADRGLLNIKTALVLTLAGEAVVFLVLPLLRSQGLIFTVALLIAFTIGAGIVVFPVTLASYFGHKKMSLSFGIVVASAGMLSFVKPCLIGHFRDRVGAYDWLFVICGVLNAIGAAFWLLVVAWERSRTKKEVIHNKSSPAYTIITTNCINSFPQEGPR